MTMKIIVASALFLFASCCSIAQPAASFWFTDTSLFQQPIQEALIQPNDQVIPAPTIAQTVDGSASILVGQTAAAELLMKNIEPWVKVEQEQARQQKPTTVAQQQQQQQQQQQRQQQQSEQLTQEVQQQQCQCNSELLQNQTNSWLNKWITSPNVANQLRSLLLLVASNSNSNSNATANIGGSGRSQAREAPNSSNHWAAWLNRAGNSRQSTAAASSASSSSRLAAGSNGGANGVTSQPIIRAARNKQGAQVNGMQPPAQVLVGERGPQGPKGEQGARGERGPSGGRLILSVKDRNGLFDLASAKKQATTSAYDNNNNKQTSVDAADGGRRLVFIESEQVLVVGTDSGWRPIQLLAPLLDYRSAKGSAGNKEDRRRLVLLNGGGGGRNRSGGQNMEHNSIKAIMRHEPLSAATSMLVSGVGTDSIRGGNRIALTNDLTEDDGVVVVVDDDDGDGDNDDDNDDEDEDEEDEEAEDDTDEDENENGNGNEDSASDYNTLDGRDRLSVTDASIRLREASVGGTQSPPGGGSRDKRRMATTTTTSTVNGKNIRRQQQSSSSLISGRSAISAAAFVSASIADSSSLEGQNNNINRNNNNNKQQNAAAATENVATRRSGSSTLASSSAAVVTTPAGGGDKRIKLRMAALNEPFSGNMHGIRGADFECKRNAARANVKGSFRAFLASGFQSLNEVVRYNVYKYPIVNMRGESLANSWHDLFKQPARMVNPLSRIYSFEGRHVATDPKWPNKLVWHGAANKAGYRDPVLNCDGWHSDSLSKFGLATPLHSPRLTPFNPKRRGHRKRYLSVNSQSSSNYNSTADTNSIAAFLEPIEKYPCRSPLIVLCIETVGQQSDHWSSLKDVSNEDALNLISF